MTTLRAHPWHTVLAALTIGLAAGPRVPALVLVAAALLAAAAASGNAHAVACVVALCAGAAFADARLAALDRGLAAPPAGHGETPGVMGTGAHAETILATVLESPRATTFGWRVLARAGGRTLLVRGRGVTPTWSAGEEIRATGRLRPLGERDAWLRPRHVSRVLESRSARPTGSRRGGAAGALDAVRRRAGRALTQHLPAPEAGLLRGVTLGDEAGLPRSSLDELRAAGLGHIVAASGQNVALLAVLVQALGALAGIGWRGRLLLTLALIALYVPLAGSGPSIQRAGVMGAATVVAALASRPSARWHALLLAAAVTLALDPASLEQPGWQLSFAAVAAIALLAAPLASALQRRGAPYPVAATIALTVAATIGTAPVSAAVFGKVSVAGLVTNVIVAPVVAPITWIGMIAASLAQVSPAAGAWTAAAAGPPLAFVLGVARAFGGLEVAQVEMSTLVAGFVSGAAVLLIGSASARRSASARLSLGAVPAAVAVAALLAGIVLTTHRDLGQPPAPAPGALRVTFLDVGQGDATLLQAGASALLVDSGRPDGEVVTQLRRAGVGRLSAMVATHAQADHLGGADEVLGAMPVGLVVDGRDGVVESQGQEMAGAARARGVPSARPAAGDRLRVGGMQVDVLWPPARPRGVPPDGDPNDRAVVLLARAAGIRVLLTADAESNVLSQLDLPPVDVLKVSHHGSADAGLPRLLERLRPRVAVIEVGAGNSYGHPVPETLTALRASGAKVLRTDRDGTVVLEAHRGGLTVHAGR